LGLCSFFHDAGISDCESLIAVAYDLAFFWKVDPEQMMGHPLDAFTESLAHAERINQLQQG